MATAMKKELFKAKKVAHPNSRKTIAIAKRTKKISNRQKAKMSGLIKQSLVGEKMMWLKEHMVPDTCPYTPELTARLLELYIARNDDEMEQIMIKRSIGGKRNRQHASREDAIRMTKEREQEEYNTCGIEEFSAAEIPDILNTAQCEMLRNWDGDLRYLTNFKFRRFGRKHLSETLQKGSREPKRETTNHRQRKALGKIENSEQVQPNNSENQLEQVNSAENNQSEECSMQIE